MTTVETATQELLALSTEARAASALLSDLTMSCPVHKLVIDERCETCAPILDATVRHHQLMHRVALSQQRLSLLETEAALQAPRAKRPFWWRRLSGKRGDAAKTR